MLNTHAAARAQGVQWVRPHLEALCDTIRLGLESWAGEAQSTAPDMDQSRAAATQLHRTLATLELVGDAQLAGHVANAMHGLGNQPDAEAAGVILEAIAMLPANLERLETGAPDIPEIWQPLIDRLEVIAGPDAEPVTPIEIEADEFNEEELTQAQRVLTGRNRALFTAMAEAALGALNEAKGTLNEYLMGRSDEDSSTEPVSQLLSSVSESLSMLSLDRLAKRVANQADALNDIKPDPDDPGLQTIAHDLLLVESELEECVVFLGQPPDVLPEEAESQLPPAEYRRVMRQLVHEALDNLNQAKHQLDQQHRGKGEDESSKQASGLLKQTAHALYMSGLGDAAELLDASAGWIEGQMVGQDYAEVDRNQLESLAEALIVTEFYLDSLNRHDQRGADYLDAARSRLIDMGYLEHAAEEDADRTAAEPTSKPAEPAETALDDDDFDLKEIFLEEFDEQLAGLQSHYPDWRDQLDNQDLLTDIRRAFHTLKGSGRMAGAEQIGEFAWAFEQILNQTMEGQYGPDQVVDLIGQAIGQLPELRERFVDDSNAALPDAAAELVTQAEQLDQPASMPELEGLDPALVKLMIKEIGEHLQTVEAWVDNSRQQGWPQPVSSELILSLHTIKGTLRLAPIGDEAESLQAVENYMQDLLDDETEPDEDATELMADVQTLLKHRLNRLQNQAVAETHFESAALTERANQLAQRLHRQARDEDSTETESAVTPETALDETDPAVESEVEPAAPEQPTADELELLPAGEFKPTEPTESSEPAFDLDQTGSLSLADADQDSADEPASDRDAAEPADQDQTEAEIEADADDAEPDVAHTDEPADKTLSEETAEPADEAKIEHAEEASDTLQADAASADEDASDEPLEDQSHEPETVEQELESTPFQDSTEDALFEAEADDEEPDEPASTSDTDSEVDQIEESDFEAVEASSSGDEDWTDSAISDEQEPFAHGEDQGDRDTETALDDERDAIFAEDEFAEWTNDDEASDESTSETEPTSVEASGSEAEATDGVDIDETARSDREDETLAVESAPESAVDVDTETLPEEEPVPELESEPAPEEDDKSPTLADASDDTDDTDGLDDSDDELDEDAPDTSEADDGRLEDDEAGFDEESDDDATDAETTPEMESDIQVARVAEFEPWDPAQLGQLDAPERAQEPAADSDNVAATAESTATSVHYAELDQDLLELFVEEGHERLESADAVLQQWREAPADRSLVTALQRDVHTIKGSARMAGLNAIGEVAHVLEDLLEGIAGGQQQATPESIDSFETGSDHLHAMLEAVAARQPMPTATHFGELEIETEEAAAPVPDDDALAPAADTSTQRSSTIRMDSSRIEELLNFAGEVSIFRSRIEQELGGFRNHVSEIEETVQRLRGQLRKLEQETETQILSRHEREREDEDSTFDPLEMDRYSTIQQLSRALAESVSDLNSLTELMDSSSRQSETLLMQQARVNTELQEGLMQARMVSFSTIAPRLRRVVRNAARDVEKQAELNVRLSGEGELDRNILDRMTAPIEHILRNAVAHGLETTDQRKQADKSETGQITIDVEREATELIIRISDDGQGLNLDKIRDRALDQNLLSPEQAEDDDAVAQMIFQPGFSTADEVSELSGRGVGMEVVASETRQIGGRINVQSEPGQGAQFELRIPLSLAVMQAIFVQAGERSFAIPLQAVRGVARISPDDWQQALAGDGLYRYGGDDFPLIELEAQLGLPPAVLEEGNMSLLMIAVGNQRAAIRVSEIQGHREIVLKPVGPQVSAIPGVLAGTIMGDGQVVIILDIAPLIGRAIDHQLLPGHVEDTTDRAVEDEVKRTPLVMVVDDSITMRRVTSRILEHHGLEVITARDGVEAVEQLYERIPDLMLLDIEMPRMDGFEVAAHVRDDQRLQDLSIMMITSRSGDKHRDHAKSLGVNRYMIKPYQEAKLVREVFEMLDLPQPNSKD